MDRKKVVNQEQQGNEWEKQEHSILWQGKDNGKYRSMYNKLAKKVMSVW